MKRSLPAFAVALLVSGPCFAQAPAPVYQSQGRTTSAWHLDVVNRLEWNPKPPAFLEDSRRLIRARPRLELGRGVLVLGAGGDFIYGSDKNTVPPAGTAVLPLLRDNYKSRDARLDLAFLRITPVSALIVQGGRFAMPIRFTEMIWDRDLRPQGASVALDLPNLGLFQKLTVSGVFGRGSHILPEGGAFELDERDTVWMGAATATLGAGQADVIELTGAFVKFDDLERVSLPLRRQNTRNAGALALKYEVVDLIARYRSEGRVPLQLVADYCWNTALDADNRGLWLAVVLGSVRSARSALEYTYASVDKDATLAAYATDDFIWGTGWAGHRADLGFRAGDHASVHAVGQLQRFKDSPQEAERDVWVKRLRLEARIFY